MSVIGSLVKQVQATDQDKGDNARIQYSLLSGMFLIITSSARGIFRCSMASDYAMPAALHHIIYYLRCKLNAIEKYVLIIMGCEN